MLIDFLEGRFFNRKKERGLVTSLLIDLSAILLWRGIWGMLDLYIFPSHPEFSFFFSAAMGLVLLILIKFFSKS